MSTHSLLILPGDGIGPEVMAEVRKVIDWLGSHRAITFEVSEDLVGGAAYDVHGVPLHDDTMAKAQAVDAVLLGAVGGPKYDNLDFNVKPERGLLRLRKEMDLFANLRPEVFFGRVQAQDNVGLHELVSNRKQSDGIRAVEDSCSEFAALPPSDSHCYRGVQIAIGEPSCRMQVLYKCQDLRIDTPTFENAAMLGDELEDPIDVVRVQSQVGKVLPRVMCACRHPKH